MKKIILSIVFAGTMLIGNATPPAQEDPCFDEATEALDNALEENPNLSQQEMTDLMNYTYAACWLKNN